MKTLVIVAHPDDEVLGCGGTIAKLHRTKQIDAGNYQIISQGRNDPIDQKFDDKPLIYFTKEIERMIKQINPEVVYTHTRGDINQDHHVVHDAVKIACRPTRSNVKRIYAFNSTLSPFDNFRPNHFVELSYDDIQKKIETMLEKYPTEMDLPYRNEKGIWAQARYWGSQIGVEYAEAFETIINIQ